MGSRGKLCLEPGLLSDCVRCSVEFWLNFGSGGTSRKAGIEKQEESQKVLVY